MAPLLRASLIAASLLVVIALGTRLSSATPSDRSLRGVEAFSHLETDADRSAALFAEAAMVFQHPRCVNCHPSGDRPLQGEGVELRLHEPPVLRGKDGFGVAGLHCSTCHQNSNFEPAQLPGAPHWHLAPLSMAWQGKSVAEICAQLKDPTRNGGRDLEEIVHHVENDGLVAWGWEPGPGREPAPGSQAELTALVRAWVDSGAACPSDSAAPSDTPGEARR